MLSTSTSTPSSLSTSACRSALPGSLQNQTCHTDDREKGECTHRCEIIPLELITLCQGTFPEWK